MITNQKEKNKYIEEKIYIPNKVKNQNYIYYFNGDYINIITNQNCTTTMNTTNCDCYQYNWKQNILTEKYTCRYNTTYNNTISYQKITDDINYNNEIIQKYTNEKIIGIGTLIIAIILCIMLTKERTYI